MSWPTTLMINAWTGEASATGTVSPRARAWVLRERPRQVSQYLVPPPPAALTNWRDPRVGWGLILPPPGDDLSPVDVAAGADAPEPIRALLASRPGAPVFRYIATHPYNLTHLQNPAAGQDPMIGQPPFGIGGGGIPRYLLIYGTPEEIPWDFQYMLNGTYYAGRLALAGEALERYVQALLTDWQDASSRVDQPVVWAVNHGAPDITDLMRDCVAAQVYEAWESDDDLRGKARFIDGSATIASTASLIETLAERKPALVVTTSHGQTGPLGDAGAMAANLGLLVDQDGAVLQPDDLLAQWEPNGAVWYAHACCSAGSDAATSYEGLVEAGSPVDRVLKAVAGLGSRVAPLPTALLGARKPMRAFIGHVEPTFDWTLRQPETGQPLTANIKQALYDNLYHAQPVGLALHDCFMPLSALRAQYDRNYNLRNSGQDTISSLLYSRLVARDLESMVILGDPTATLPQLATADVG